VTNEPAFCRSCGTNTTPCTGRRGCRHAGKWDWYMVKPGVWDAVGGGNGFLCIPCLEQLIGRPLNRGDFVDAPVNDPSPWNTPRLAAALAREVSL
jgi:hypothetical protein